MCKYHHTCMCVATGKVNGSHWRIMIFIWLLSSVPPLFPRLAALWPPVLSPPPTILLSAKHRRSEKGNKSARWRGEEMQKVKKVENDATAMTSGGLRGSSSGVLLGPLKAFEGCLHLKDISSPLLQVLLMSNNTWVASCGFRFPNPIYLHIVGFSKLDCSRNWNGRSAGS